VQKPVILILFFLFGCTEETSIPGSAEKNNNDDPKPTSPVTSKESVFETAKPDICSCDIKAFETDEVNSITLYPSPADSSGKRIFADKTKYYHFLLKVAASADGWLQLGRIYETNEVDINEKSSDYREFKSQQNWWVPAGKVFIGTSDICCDLNLYAFPSDTSAVIGYYTGKITGVISCNGTWLKVAGFSKSGKNKIFGWVPFKLMCLAFNTNCAQEIPKKYIYRRLF
jgi:hypothetical protein